jgi:sec-independent protein translocase protein TatB
MFSLPHLIVIFVVALIIFGPEKLPELARNLGKVMGEFRRATGDLQSTFEGHLRDLERDAESRKIAGPHAPGEAANPTLPPSPFEYLTPGSPEGTKPSDAPNAAAIAAGNAEVDSAVEAATGTPVTVDPPNPEGHSLAGTESSSLAGSSEPERPYNHVSDAGFGQS